MIHFCSEALLKEVCDSDAGHNLPTILVEITATVLDQEVGRKKMSPFYENSTKKTFYLLVPHTCQYLTLNNYIVLL